MFLNFAKLACAGAAVLAISGCAYTDRFVASPQQATAPQPAVQTRVAPAPVRTAPVSTAPAPTTLANNVEEAADVPAPTWIHVPFDGEMSDDDDDGGWN